MNDIPDRQLTLVHAVGKHILTHELILAWQEANRANCLYELWHVEFLIFLFKLAHGVKYIRLFLLLLVLLHFLCEKYIFISDIFKDF